MCCDGLLAIKKEIKIFALQDMGHSPNLPSNDVIFCLAVLLDSGTHIPLFFCPYCGEELTYEASIKEIHFEEKQEE